MYIPYLLHEYMLGSVFQKHRYMMSRTARLTTLWLSLFGELLFIGTLIHTLGADMASRELLIPLIACIIVVFTGPVFTMLFKVGEDKMP